MNYIQWLNRAHSLDCIHYDEHCLLSLAAIILVNRGCTSELGLYW